jgi:hypothetical protein
MAQSVNAWCNLIIGDCNRNTNVVDYDLDGSNKEDGEYMPEKEWEDQTVQDYDQEIINTAKVHNNEGKDNSIATNATPGQNIAGVNKANQENKNSTKKENREVLHPKI